MLSNSYYDYIILRTPLGVNLNIISCTDKPKNSTRLIDKIEEFIQNHWEISLDDYSISIEDLRRVVVRIQQHHESKKGIKKIIKPAKTSHNIKKILETLSQLETVIEKTTKNIFTNSLKLTFKTAGTQDEPLFNLPTELFFQIFSYCDQVDRSSISQVCKQLYLLSKSYQDSPHFWHFNTPVNKEEKAKLKKIISENYITVINRTVINKIIVNRVYIKQQKLVEILLHHFQIIPTSRSNQQEIKLKSDLLDRFLSCWFKHYIYSNLAKSQERTRISTRLDTGLIKDDLIEPLLDYLTSLSNLTTISPSFNPIYRIFELILTPSFLGLEDKNSFDDSKPGLYTIHLSQSEPRLTLSCLKKIDLETYVKVNYKIFYGTFFQLEGLAYKTFTLDQLIKRIQKHCEISQSNLPSLSTPIQSPFNQILQKSPLKDRFLREVEEKRNYNPATMS